MDFLLRYFGGGGFFLEKHKKRNTKKEKLFALVVFFSSILSVYLIYGDFLSTPVFEETPCRMDLNNCPKDMFCIDMWVECTASQTYKYDPITTIFFGKNQCGSPNIYRSVCVDIKNYNAFVQDS
ncbi:MAG: hypothetical protein KAI53_00155 [Candidatus Aenigmarchaeota archaeon]|nr:hypothetical protein [Candidatus Aenigmarchaeota archaeon]